MAAILGLTAKGQIPNWGFEQVNADGRMRNWGNVYLMPMYIDSMGNSYVDSIVFDNYFYFRTADSHWGSTAMELRNAWDYTTNMGIAGSATADTDTAYSAWGSFETFPITNQPFNFSFFYKYFPLNNETGSATLQLFDSAMNLMSETVILLSATGNNYTLATAPVIYSLPGTAAFAYINFSTAAYGSTVSFGTRLIIDDVMFNYVSAGINYPKEETISIFPNPAHDWLDVKHHDTSLQYSVEITDISGKTLSHTTNRSRIDISQLSPATYFIKVLGNEKVLVKNFIKE